MQLHSLKVPQVPLMDKHTVDVLVVMQRQTLVVQKAQKTVEVLQIQYIDMIVDVPEVLQRQAPTIQTVEKTEEDQGQWRVLRHVSACLISEKKTVGAGSTGAAEAATEMAAPRVLL